MAEYIATLTDDAALQQATADKYIAAIREKQEKMDAIEALELEDDVAFWNDVKARLAQPVAVETQTEEGATAQAPEATPTPMAMDDVAVQDVEESTPSVESSTSNVESSTSVPESQIENESGNENQSGEDVNEASNEEVQLSDEVDENGRQFVLNSKGEIVFGEIAEDTGLTPAPILLSEGLITNPATNDGYGLVHIEARHGEQIRNAGYNSVVAFVEEVAKNYERIREGINRDGHQTYMLQLTDKHNNTLMVELSGDGTYWNINTAGIFKTSYGKNRKEVYNRHTTAKQSTETVEESQDIEQSGTQTSSGMNTPTTSSTAESTTQSANSQENSVKSGENAQNEGENHFEEENEPGARPTNEVSNKQTNGLSNNVDDNVENNLKNGINELNLQQENVSNNGNKDNTPVGGQVPESVPQGEHGAQTAQAGGMEETAARLRERIGADGGAPQTGVPRDVREVENRVTREYAKENGLWIPFDDVFKLGRPSKSGNEHDTYLNAEQRVIYKVNNRMNTPSILDLLDRMEQHNKYFPDSKYSLVGFTAVSENGDVWPVFAQDYVPDARMASIEEIDGYMSALGFTRIGDGRYSNSEVVIKDLKPRNVLADVDGDVFVVDAEFEAAEQESGENRSQISENSENEGEKDVIEEIKAALGGAEQKAPTIGEQIQAAEAEVNTNPTEAQKEAGNYKKGHVQIGTFNVTIEQPKGSVRSGVDADGKKWETEMQNTYGYIRGTEGVDGDHIDVFLSDDIDGWDGHKVFVVDQRNADGSFDEHKVMLGFNDINDAEAAYMSNYEEGWQGLGAITGVSIEEFEKWIASSHRKTKAFAEYKSVKTTEGQNASAERRNRGDFKEGDVVRDYYDKKLYRIKKHSKNGVSTIAILDEEGNEVGTTTMNAHNNSRYSLAEAPVKAETPTISQESEQVSETDAEEDDTVLSESEYADARSAEIMADNPNLDDVEAYNMALDEYPKYIGDMINSGKLSKIYKKANIGERIALNKSIQAAGYEISDVNAQEVKEGSKKAESKFKVGDEVTATFGDGSVVSGVIEKIEDGRIKIRSNGRLYPVDESKIGKGVELQRGSLSLESEKPAFKAATEKTMQALEKTGVEVVMATEEQVQEVMEIAEMQKRTAPETVSVQDEHLQTVVSSADGAKVLKDLDNAMKEYENDAHTKEKTFLGNLAKVLGAKKHGSNSQYVTFEAVNGKVFTIRLANHNAKTSTFDNHDENEGISIVVTAQKNKGVTNDGEAHLVEFFYDAIKLRKSDDKPLVEILKSIKQSLYSGEYTDNTGLAVREEVNVPEFLRTSEGTVYGWSVGGRIYLTPEGVNPNTPVHEYTHLWASAIEQRSPELWAEVVEAVKLSPAWAEVSTDEAYRNIWNDDSRMASEVLARLSGGENYRHTMQEAAERENDAARKFSLIAAWGRVKRALAKFWNKVREMLDLPVNGEPGNAVPAWERFVNSAIGDFYRGVNPNVGNSPMEMMFIGEQGARNLDNAQEATTRMGMSEEEQQITDRAKADGTYMKAPNGKDTNLSPKQWVQVRTKAFKKWFGDWLLAATETPIYKSKGGFATLAEAEKWAKENLQGQSRVNKHTGEEISISRKSVNEMLAPKFTKTVNEHVHMSALQSVLDFIETGIPAEVHADTHGRDFDVMRLYNAIEIDGKVYRVKSTVRKVKEGDKYYTYEIQEMELLEDTQNVLGLLNAESGGQLNSNNSITGAKLLNGVKKTNSNEKILQYSKVVDENGEPKILEHSTWDDGFYTFDIKRLGESSGDEGVYGAGFYFGNVGHTQLYGDRAIQVYLDMKNPMYLPDSNAMEFFDYLVDNFDKEGLRDIVVKGNGKTATMGKVVDTIKEIQANYDNGEYAELIESIRGIWSSPEDRVVEQKIFHKLGFAFYRGIAPFIEKNIGRRKFSEALRNAGYDGVIFDNREWVAFSPNQIKSATDNVGTFSSENDDIRYRSFGGNSGYVGYSMSKRAAEARREGRYPKTDFKKEYGVSGKSFDFLRKAGIISSSEWHHTSKFGNRTDFFSWSNDTDAEYYAANKKRIDKAINDVEKLKPEYDVMKAIDKYLSEGRSQDEISTLIDEESRQVEPAEKRYKDARKALAEQLEEEFYNNYEQKSEAASPDADIRYRATEVDAEAERTDAEIAAAVERLSAELNTPVEIVTNLSTSPDVRKRASKGWYEGDRVYLVLPNAESVQDAVETVLHEVVGHRGLRALFGERFDAMLDDVFTGSSKAVRSAIMERALPLIGRGRDNAIRVATEEYMAEQAERGFDDYSLWDKVRGWFRNMLRSMGLDVEIGDNEIRYMLWRSYRRMKRGETFAEELNNKIMEARFRNGDGTIAKYESRVNTRGLSAYNAREAFQDEMLSLKEFQRIVEEKYGEKIPSYLNVYDYENRMSSVGFREFMTFSEQLYEPLQETIDEMFREGAAQEDVTAYLIAKSGLERNRDFSVRDYLAKMQESKETPEGVTDAVAPMTKAEADAKMNEYMAEKARLLAELNAGSIGFRYCLHTFCMKIKAMRYSHFPIVEWWQVKH